VHSKIIVLTFCESLWRIKFFIRRALQLVEGHQKIEFNPRSLAITLTTADLDFPAKVAGWLPSPRSWVCWCQWVRCGISLYFVFRIHFVCGRFGSLNFFKSSPHVLHESGWSRCRISGIPSRYPNLGCAGSHAMQFVAVCCSELQCVTVCCSVSHTNVCAWACVRTLSLTHIYTHTYPCTYILSHTQHTTVHHNAHTLSLSHTHIHTYIHTSSLTHSLSHTHIHTDIPLYTHPLSYTAHQTRVVVCK